MRPSAPSSVPNRQPLIAGGIIALVAAMAYHGSLRVPFFFDDNAAIGNNPTIRDLARLDVLLPPHDGSGAAGRPLVNLSLAINYAIGGVNPRGYHLFNVALHAITSLGLFGIVRRMLSASANGFTSSATALAATIALLWAVHPLQTESVSCVIQRTELLVSLFYVLTLYCFVRSLDSPMERAWQFGAIAACALGMASKEVMVSAPCIVLLYDRTFAAGSFRAAWRQRASFYLWLAASWAVLGQQLWSLHGARGSAAGFGLGVPWWAYALKQADAVVTYLKLAAWPHPLVIDYGTNLVADARQVVLQLIFVGLLLLTTGYLVWRRRKVGFVLLAFVAILAPSSSIVPLVSQTVAEHRMYLPLAAVVAMIGLGSYQVLGRRIFGVAAFVALPFVLLVTARNRQLQDEVTLWRETTASAPDNARAHASLALALADHGRPRDAIPHYQRALELDPKSVATEENLGNAYYQVGDYGQATSHFRRAVALDSRFASGYNNLGAGLLALDDNRGSLAALTTALELDPNQLAAHRNIARTLFALERYGEAATHYELVERAHPESAEAHYDYGLALARAGEVDRGAEQMAAALRLSPSPGSYLNYARFLAQAGRIDAAIAAAATAVRLRPDYVEARAELERLRSAAAAPH
jgi:protein O-mannosyl-transferase